MAIREEAQRNHDVLFPNHASTLKVIDPELVELFIGYPRTLNAIRVTNEGTTR